MAATIDSQFKFALRLLTSYADETVASHLDDDEVHVWSVGLHDQGLDISGLRGLLSSDECERAARFHFDRHRAQYVVTRGTLRWLLGSYLAVSPREISFGYSDHGKPCLAAPVNMHVEFNISHTEGMAIFGFTRGRRIGVDVENIRSGFKADEIAERFFSPSERTSLGEIPVAQRHEAFFRIWTRKEAYIKARGEGLSHPLHQFDVSLDDAARLIATRPDAAEAQRWQLENLSVAPGFAAAAVVETCGAHASAR
jgi:4'-phosphopantetheinyl transferase